MSAWHWLALGVAWYVGAALHYRAWHAAADGVLAACLWPVVWLVCLLLLLSAIPIVGARWIAGVSSPRRDWLAWREDRIRERERAADLAMARALTAQEGGDVD